MNIFQAIFAFSLTIASSFVDGLPSTLSETTHHAVLSLDNETVSFDVREGAKYSQPLNRQLINLSIEFCFIVDFLGDVGNLNLFSKQLLRNIEDRAGVAPIIRIGGNTADSSYFCRDCNETLVNVYGAENTEAVKTTYNQRLFEVLEEYDSGITRCPDKLSVAQAEIEASTKCLDQSYFYSYELGNEVNIYQYTGHRDNNWTVLSYAADTLQWLPTLVQLTKMNVPQAMGAVKSFSSHAYPQNVCSEPAAALVTLDYYLNHLNTIQFFSAWESEIAAGKSVGADFHIGVAGSAACHGKDGVSNTMAALLWEIDYALYAATVGVDRIFFHNGVGDFYYSMWEPVAVNSSSLAHINPT
ncbi:hypothetical protein PENARI_c015G10875 [Penicillium arizonense]|uniref:Beta-glucuronidase C-terminal domain-containing protein n=1 Tax=Penicillium arizonense TaxID=1835702 RepID=A0A1F5LCX8_PENAI|nr:hypothetical protein PENARI_c015G10875 [Penicillium arizonense]OGE50947.1 hypothetical protein PENARI_c015G10875 [Penicillium arizonense]